MTDLSLSVTAVSDAELLAQFAAGDPRAARRLTDRLAPLVFRLCYRLLGDRAEAEDITQEAMMKLWKIAPEWRLDGAAPSTWLYTVARNACMDRLRRKRSVPLDEAGEMPDPAPSADRILSQAERAEALQAALGDLPVRQREAVVLRHLEGLSNPEIAGIMEISVEAVESLTSRGKRMLAKALGHRRAELGFTE